MKKYTAPTINITKVSNVDIIQTSGLVIGGTGSNDNPMEWALRNTNPSKNADPFKN